MVHPICNDVAFLCLIIIMSSFEKASSTCFSEDMLVPSFELGKTFSESSPSHLLFISDSTFY